MAVVTGFDRQNIQRAKRHPTETECAWATFEDGGRRYLQIESSGSKERRTSGVSQTYQFDRDSAAQLIRTLQQGFLSSPEP
jgi:hypothetical protein